MKGHGAPDRRPICVLEWHGATCARFHCEQIAEVRPADAKGAVSAHILRVLRCGLGGGLWAHQPTLSVLGGALTWKGC